MVRWWIFAPWEYRVRKLMRRAGFSTLPQAAAELAERERSQIAYFMEHYGQHPHDRTLYDLELTNSLIGHEDHLHHNLARQVVRAAGRLANAPVLEGEPV